MPVGNMLWDINTDAVDDGCNANRDERHDASTTDTYTDYPFIGAGSSKLRTLYNNVPALPSTNTPSSTPEIVESVIDACEAESNLVEVQKAVITKLVNLAPPIREHDLVTARVKRRKVRTAELTTRCQHIISLPPHEQQPILGLLEGCHASSGV